MTSSICDKNIDHTSKILNGHEYSSLIQTLTSDALMVGLIGCVENELYTDDY